MPRPPRRHACARTRQRAELKRPPRNAFGASPPRGAASEPVKPDPRRPLGLPLRSFVNIRGSSRSTFGASKGAGGQPAALHCLPSLREGSLRSPGACRRQGVRQARNRPQGLFRVRAHCSDSWPRRRTHEVSAVSSAARPRTEHRSGVAAQRRPPQHEPLPGTACRDARSSPDGGDHPTIATGRKPSFDVSRSTRNAMDH